uniref:SFRICE_021080 n=1 Tax=Spodoptera frugiperda TaxID=7108 RepID=A0A2H1W382_SPOFR
MYELFEKSSTSFNSYRDSLLCRGCVYKHTSSRNLTQQKELLRAGIEPARRFPAAAPTVQSLLISSVREILNNFKISYGTKLSFIDILTIGCRHQERIALRSPFHTGPPTRRAPLHGFLLFATPGNL